MGSRLQLEGTTEKFKNPYTSPDLERYIWAIARRRILVLVSFLCHRRLAYQDDGQYRTQESGNFRRRAIYVLVNLCVTRVERHMGLVHGIGFKIVF
jgi:hypothetical protein